MSSSVSMATMCGSYPPFRAGKMEVSNVRAAAYLSALSPEPYTPMYISVAPSAGVVDTEQLNPASAMTSLSLSRVFSEMWSEVTMLIADDGVMCLPVSSIC